MPAKAGIQNYLKTLDSRLRGNDAKGRFKTFYETIKFTMRDVSIGQGSIELTTGPIPKSHILISSGKTTSHIKSRSEFISAFLFLSRTFRLRGETG